MENFRADRRRARTMVAMSAPLPRARRRFALDPRLLIGLLLVAASVVAVVALVGAADRRVTVYAAPDDLAPGDRVAADDLVERSVALDGAEDLYLAVDDIPEDGFVVAQPVAAGQLVPLSAAGSTDGLRATSMVLRLAAPVSAVVGTGTLVDVWGVPGSDPLDQEAAGAPVVLVAEATVVRIVEEETLITGAAGSGSTVEVLVPRTRVARVLQAIADGDAISVVPAGLPLASR